MRETAVMDHEGDLADGRERDLAPVAALFGDRAHLAMLAALADGRALPAGELARRARVHPATASAHLSQLVDGGLVRVRAQGRHRYHELAGPQVATVIEALAQLAPPSPIRSLRQDRQASALAEARTCYDHLAGRRGVELRDRLLAADALAPSTTATTWSPTTAANSPPSWASTRTAFRTPGGSSPARASTGHPAVPTWPGRYPRPSPAAS